MKLAIAYRYLWACLWVAYGWAGGSCSSLQQVKVQVHEAQKRRNSVLALKKAFKNNQVVDQRLVIYIATACAGQQAKEILSIAIDHGDVATVGTLLQHGSSLHSSKTNTPKQGLSRKSSFNQSPVKPPVKQCWQ